MNMEYARKEGIREDRRRIEKKMKKENADIDFIVKITGLTKKEINAL